MLMQHYTYPKSKVNMNCNDQEVIKSNSLSSLQHQMDRDMRQRVFEHMRIANTLIRLCMRCPQTESLDSIKCLKGEQLPR